MHEPALVRPLATAAAAILVSFLLIAASLTSVA